MSNFADRVISFNRNLRFEGALPDGIGIMNPFRENEWALPVSSEFYRKYYSDNEERHIILGINPGRFGAGLTGVPFTDPKRLVEKCEISFPGPRAHEPSSVFVYKVIDAFGGNENFYKKFYINSLCPLGFVRKTDRGEVNYNYYDSRELTAAVADFIHRSILQHLSLGVSSELCFCLGTGENYRYFNKINGERGYFKRIIPLDHPRFVMQYKAKSVDQYIEKYVKAFENI